MLIEIAYVNKEGGMRVDYVRFKNKKECEKVIKEKCPTAEIIWSAPNKVFVTEQYSKNKNEPKKSLLEKKKQEDYSRRQEK